MFKRIIYIGLNECADAVKSKDRLEAYSFALLAKLTFVDSIIKSTSIREMTKIFRMGWTRLNRILKNALHYGYIIKEGNHYFIPSLKQNGSYNEPVVFSQGSFSFSQEGRTPYRIKNLILKIRELVFKNHIRKQMSFQDTASVVNAPIDPNEYKRKRARLKRMSGLTAVSDDLLDNTARISMKRIAEVMGTKRSTTKKIVKNLRTKGEIIRCFESIPLNYKQSELEKDYRMAQSVWLANKLGGFIYRSCGRVYIQVANRYSLPENELHSIKFIPKNV